VLKLELEQFPAAVFACNEELLMQMLLLRLLPHSSYLPSGESPDFWCCPYDVIMVASLLCSRASGRIRPAAAVNKIRAERTQ
jgi:hypothetical protein